MCSQQCKLAERTDGLPKQGDAQAFGCPSAGDRFAARPAFAGEIAGTLATWHLRSSEASERAARFLKALVIMRWLDGFRVIDPARQRPACERTVALAKDPSASEPRFKGCVHSITDELRQHRRSHCTVAFADAEDFRSVDVFWSRAAGCTRRPKEGMKHNYEIAFARVRGCSVCRHQAFGPLPSF